MTLRANELRIGNKALLGELIVTIDEISNDGIETREEGFISVHQLKGIPLTEEWLLKFGFYRNNSAWEDPKKFNTGFSVWNPVGSKVFEMNSDPIMTRIEFVHQLQNIYFAVTGIELPLANHPV